MQLKCIQGLYLVWSCCLFLLYIYLPLHEPNVSAQIYTSRNECISHETQFAIEFKAEYFHIHQKIQFETISPVTSCYFAVEGFEIEAVWLSVDEKPLLIGIDVIDDKMLVLKLVTGFFQPKTNYSALFQMSKRIKQAGAGLIFKVYRDLYSFKTNWYAIVKIGPAQCGKVYVCINSLLSFQTLVIEAHHPATHRLFCPGKVTKRKPVIPGYQTSQCNNSLKVGVNNMHFSVADFHHLEYTYTANDSGIIHNINLVSPRDEHGLIYTEIIEHFRIIKSIYSLLVLGYPITSFDVYFYFLPNAQHFDPLILSGICLFSFQDIRYNIEIESTLQAYLRCLLHQAWMNERIMNSWSLRFVLEGLFEVFVNIFDVAYRYTGENFRDCIEGEASDLAPLANYYADASLVRFEGPWRKAAGLFSMLGTMSTGEYLAWLMWHFVQKQTTVDTYSRYIHFLSEHGALLQLNQTGFLEMLSSWTEPDGYVVIEVQVPIKRLICISQYNVGSYYRSRILPIQVTYNYPEIIRSPKWWKSPKSEYNCEEIRGHTLYPYLVNAELNMVGRVLYDSKNWRKWASRLMDLDMRNSLTAMQRNQLVTDALYFAAQGKLSYSIAMKYFFVMRVETDEISWRNFDKTLTFLEAQTRYTSAYPLFQRMMVDVSMRFFNHTFVYTRLFSSSIKWSCWMGNLVCREHVTEMRKETLKNPFFRPDRREILCAGMRTIEFDEYKAIVRSMGMPDVREPDFYVDMLMCAENKHVLRDILFYLFFDNTWKFRRSHLTAMMIKMIRMSKAGSDMALFYLRHDPLGMVKLLGFAHFLEIVQELAFYMRENYWFVRMVTRLKMNGVVSEDLFVQHRPIMDKMKENKRWFNTKYPTVYQFLATEYGRLVPYMELEEGHHEDPYLLPNEEGGL